MSCRSSDSDLKKEILSQFDKMAKAQTKDSYLPETLRQNQQLYQQQLKEKFDNFFTIGQKYGRICSQEYVLANIQSWFQNPIALDFCVSEQKNDTMQFLEESSVIVMDVFSAFLKKKPQSM